jgi:hypothetical protein
VVELKPSCASAVERVELEKINKMEPATRNGFDHPAALNNLKLLGYCGC